MFDVLLPCKPGDTVMAYLDDAPTKNRKLYHSSECVILSIEFHRDWPEPLFTAVCYEKATYSTFWQSDFGKEIYNMEQYIELALIDSGAK